MTEEPGIQRLAEAIERHRFGTTATPSNTRRAELRRRETVLAGYHQARLLVLFDAIAGRNGSVRGLTKIAKLDFLLRYPSFLEQLLLAIHKDDLAERVKPTDDERKAVESRMVRYKYGPWDDRYYSIIGGLVGRGLAEYVDSTEVLTIRLTAGGRAVASSLITDPAWVPVAERAAIIKEAFGRMTGNGIKELIYAHLPGVVDRPHRMEI
ncbi:MULTISPECIES: hypothetical protein [unclassified Knoellia]|uniref:hypothetical protein n=1 Tax=Knoellia altitudinis TaxID=3404795 RepID=UPI00360CED85